MPRGPVRRGTITQGSIRTAALDRHHSRRRSALVVGPVEVPSVAQVRERVRAMAAAGPFTRVGLHPSPTRARWTHDPRAGGCEVRASGGDDEPLRLLDEVRSSSDRPLRVVLGHEYIAIDFDHGLGDATLLNVVVSVILGSTDPHDRRTWRRFGHRTPPLALASAAVCADPRRVVALARLLRRAPTEPGGVRTTGEAASVPGPSGTVGGVDAATGRRPRATLAHVPAATVAEVRAARDRDCPGVGMYALTTVALVDALTEAGVDLHPTITAPFDARVYLPRARNTLANFSAGLAFAVPPGSDPVELQRALTASARMGRPIANLAITSVKTLASSRRTADPPPAVLTDVPVPLLHSSVGTVPGRDHRWTWLADERARVFSVADPPTPQGLTVTTALVGGGMSVAAAYFDGAVPSAAVADALAALPDRLRALVALT
ncbi:hypothetical protein GPOL_c40530 [Gordonia polyisoprenivorans VH2]|uniref:Diacylglycerol O-acyltransferase n=1 Tax=Gordonia polyisoprenivorans (strain DSM 44266 / VH2) TaxID=1112204 RepID=H6MS47_GORPV|nr:hypothetical protein GPOL_c40530 [Gordonia polyisoprenivorans VH2]